MVTHMLESSYSADFNAAEHLLRGLSLMLQTVCSNIILKTSDQGKYWMDKFTEPPAH